MRACEQKIEKNPENQYIDQHNGFSTIKASNGILKINLYDIISFLSCFHVSLILM